MSLWLEHRHWIIECHLHQCGEAAGCIYQALLVRLQLSLIQYQPDPPSGLARGYQLASKASLPCGVSLDLPIAFTLAYPNSAAQTSRATVH